MRRVLYLFGELDDGDIDRLIDMGERRTFASGTILIEEGHPVADIFVLLEGSLAVKTGTKGVDDVLDHPATDLADGEPEPTTARTWRGWT